MGKHCCKLRLIKPYINQNRSVADIFGLILLILVRSILKSEDLVALLYETQHFHIPIFRSVRKIAKSDFCLYHVSARMEQLGSHWRDFFFLKFGI